MSAGRSSLCRTLDILRNHENSWNIKGVLKASGTYIRHDVVTLDGFFRLIH